MDKVALREKLDLITEHWRPKIVGELNGQQVKLAKFQGHVRLASPRQRGRAVPRGERPVPDGAPGPDDRIGGGRIPHRSPGRRAPDGRRRGGRVLLFEPAATQTPATSNMPNSPRRRARACELRAIPCLPRAFGRRRGIDEGVNDSVQPVGARFYDKVKQDLGRAAQITPRASRSGSTLTFIDVVGAEPALARALSILDRGVLRIHCEDEARTCYVFRWASGYGNGAECASREYSNRAPAASWRGGRPRWRPRSRLPGSTRLRLRLPAGSWDAPSAPGKCACPWRASNTRVRRADVYSSARC